MARTPIGRGGAPLPFEGRLFGGYRIAEAIATGGMATVFLARKTGPGRYAQTAAIKIIHPHLAKNHELAEMFMDEARLASCVNHPSVCRVLDFGEAEGTYYLAMEYVRGESWATVLPALLAHPESHARITPLAAHVLAHACEGLHAIHDAIGHDGRPLNIVHRDVSPQNLLVAYDGSVRLLDFGIASAEGRAHTGSTEVVRGRYAYMAPEQMRGLDVDRRADLWSLGVMLYEAVSGYNPFIRDTQIATMLAVTQEPLPSWPEGLPEELLHIGQLTLSRAPEGRFASAREMGDALSRYLGRSGESALGAELSRHMRSLFAAQIAEKRAALRALSGGDDSGTETFPSGYPPVKASPTPPVPLEASTARARAETRRPTRKVLAAGALLFAASSGLSWYLVNEEPPNPPDAGTGAEDAQRAAHEPETPPAPIDEQRVHAERPEGLTKRPESAQTPVPSAPVPDPGLAALDALSTQSTPRKELASQTPISAEPDAEETSRERRHHRRREREEGVVEAPPERGKSAPAAATKAGGPPGTIVVGATQGWALVFEGSHKLGTTPLKMDLPSGPHTLTVRPYGEGAPRQLSVDVKPGAVTKLRIEL